jgi:hypothetical protein
MKLVSDSRTDKSESQKCLEHVDYSKKEGHLDAMPPILYPALVYSRVWPHVPGMTIIVMLCVTP